ncbi:hypothetical protein, partial [Bacteroides uniformis]|uniref:hypothetical protein n=1 Tax=Bacteroides uniformis TaxID=820 RepID=UPI00202F13F5
AGVFSRFPYCFLSLLVDRFVRSSHIEILLSINQAINISIKQDCRITKINSSVGERPAARGGTTRPDERKNL